MPARIVWRTERGQQLPGERDARVADGCNQAQHHAGNTGTTAVRLRDADHENTAERHGHPAGQLVREPTLTSHTYPLFRSMADGLAGLAGLDRT